MPDELPIPPDLLAIVDVLAELRGDAESYSKERCVVTRDGVSMVQRELKELLGVLDVVLMAQIEQAFSYREQIFYRKLGGKASADHAAIGRDVVQLAVAPDDDGVIPDAHEAARRAVRMMRALYVTPSKTPPKRAFEELELDQKKLTTWRDDESEHLEIDDLRGGR